MTCLIWADREHLTQLVSMLRELQAGLQMVFRRIRLANARAEAARRLGAARFPTNCGCLWAR